ncbi:MAG: 4Fe-4S binding protein [Bacteroidetes bacterium]|nr:4Fe-4S binding protein [Bacteroidota bacterium]MBU1578660.1 4Fe-4S binding protein [Bacteroidota bacterium]MBU2557700.1 4Fe-4S binding protein [Bacteroidota bacterium]
MNTNYLFPEKQAIVFTNKAKCRDCYRCVRVCPVHAIKMEGGQAQVVQELCIACGTCIAECPQHAKAYRTDYGKVLQWSSDSVQMVISVAPSFATSYTRWEQQRLPSALRALGFMHVAETAIGAWHTAQATAAHIEANADKNHICTACPAVVSYVRHFAGEHVHELVPVASPMMIHARLLKKKFRKAKVVFVGPCVAKKDEARQENNSDFIDAVLTFEELDEMLSQKNIALESCEESGFDEEVGGDARLFPLEGGLLRTAKLKTDLLSESHLAISGFESLKDVLESVSENEGHSYIVEPLFCRHGCINGPAVRLKKSAYQLRNAALDYAVQHPGKQEETAIKEKDFAAVYPMAVQNGKAFSEAEIKAVLASIGKYTAEDELNCSACGYNSCRDKALAVLKGMAEPEMCMPYMRRMAEHKFETMIALDPNGIVMLNDKLEIIHMNPAFRKMFSCSDALNGRPISYLIDPDIFEELATGDSRLIRKTVTYSNYNLICHLMCYTIPEQSHYVGIFLDVTDLQNKSEKLQEVKAETVIQAQSLLDHQVSMAQELARFLGEHTAKGEVLLNKLIDSIQK